MRCLVFAAATTLVWACGNSYGADDARDAGPSQTCAAGAVVAPSRAFDATPPGGTAACNVDGVLREDGQLTGLDQATANVTMLSESVSACVGVELPAGASVDRIVLRATATSNACGTPCAGAGCGKGIAMDVFAGASMSALQLAQRTVFAPTALGNIEIPAPASVDVKVVVVCRSGAGKDGEDVAVDFIGARCR